MESFQHLTFSKPHTKMSLLSSKHIKARYTRASSASVAHPFPTGLASTAIRSTPDPLSRYSGQGCRIGSSAQQPPFER